MDSRFPYSWAAIEPQYIDRRSGDTPFTVPDAPRFGASVAREGGGRRDYWARDTQKILWAYRPYGAEVPNRVVVPPAAPIFAIPANAGPFLETRIHTPVVISRSGATGGSLQ